MPVTSAEITKIIAIIREIQDGISVTIRNVAPTSAPTHKLPDRQIIAFAISADFQPMGAINSQTASNCQEALHMLEKSAGFGKLAVYLTTTTRREAGFSWNASVRGSKRFVCFESVSPILENDAS